MNLLQIVKHCENVGLKMVGLVIWKVGIGEVKLDYKFFP